MDNSNARENKSHAQRYFPLAAGVIAYIAAFKITPALRFNTGRWVKRFMLGVIEGVTDLRHIPSALAAFVATRYTVEVLNAPSHDKVDGVAVPIAGASPQTADAKARQNGYSDGTKWVDILSQKMPNRGASRDMS